MKDNNTYKGIITIFRIILLLLVFFVANEGVVVGQPQPDEYNSSNTGDWSDAVNWVEDDFPGERKTDPDVIELGNRLIINIKHEITIDGYLEGKNDIEIIIFSGAIFRIKGDLIVKNRFEIEVKDGGRFIVEGDVELDAGAGGNNPGDIMINGKATIDGDVNGNGNFSGNGDLYVSGQFEEGIEIGEFGGTIAEGIPNDEIPEPKNLNVYIDSEDKRKVYLVWGYNDGGEVDYRESKFTIEREEYKFAGFRIVRNLDGGNHLKDIIVGYFKYDASDIFIRFDDSLQDLKYTDNITDEYLEGIEGEVYPEYYVRAVFVKSNNTKSYNEDDYVLSSNSNTADTNEPLPIELYDFNAKTNQSSVTINWTTAAEINNDFFTIERSVDLFNWEIIGYADGAGDSNSMLSYRFEDNNPITGTSYYRLKQTDYDGQFEYFDPVTVQFFNEMNDVKILNVQSNGGNNMNIVVNNQDYNAKLIVADISGMVVHRQSVDVSELSQEININFPRNYTAEILLIRLHSNNNSDGKKIMVN